MIKYDESYIGRKNNRLTVVGIARDSENKRAFLCQCDCGNMKIVKPVFWENGRIKSCGCWQKRLTEDQRRLANIYNNMVQRCYNDKNSAYKNYGGRGISICDEWLNDRNSFMEWSMSHGYSEELTIDRIDVDGNYEPDNCRWVGWDVQASNKRTRIKRNGKYISLKELAKETGRTVYFIKKQMSMGKTLEEAIEMPYRNWFDDYDPLRDYKERYGDRYKYPRKKKDGTTNG